MHNLPKRFVILTEGRTGKSHFVSLLNSHPDLTVLDERLTPLIKYGAKKQLDWLDEVFYSVDRGDHVVGLATKLRSVINQDAFMDWIIKNKIIVIYMQRRNHLKLGISVYRAQVLNKKHKTYNARSENEVLKEATHIDPVVFYHHFSRRMAFETKLLVYMNKLREHLPIVDIHYEDLLSDQNHILNIVYSVLGIESNFDLKSEYFKNTSDNLADSISNLEELKEIFKGSYLEKFF